MIKLANERLARIPNVKFIQANIWEIEFQDKVDVIFKCCTTLDLKSQKSVWIFLANFKPNGELLIQCGVYGNLQRLFLHSKSENHKIFVIFFTTVKERKCGKKHGILRKQGFRKNLKRNTPYNSEVFLEKKVC